MEERVKTNLIIIVIFITKNRSKTGIQGFMYNPNQN